MTRLRLLPLLLLLLAGCDSEDPDPLPACTGNVSGFVTATIDGAPFEAECRTFAFAQGDLTVTGSTVTDGAGGRVQHAVTLVVTDVAIGPFVVGSDAAVTYEETNLDDGTTRRYTGTSGEVIIQQAFRDNPSGTFSFTASDGSETVTVTDGLFDVYR